MQADNPTQCDANRREAAWLVTDNTVHDSYGDDERHCRSECVELQQQARHT